MRRRSLALATTCLLAAPLLPTAVRAAPYSAEYVFGDSLSDRGNLAGTGLVQLAGGVAPPVRNFPDPPSFHDSFTNGPVAVQVVASALGLSADPSLWLTGFRDVNNLFGGNAYTPGTSYAVGGATAAASANGGVGTINLPQQVSAYLYRSGGAADPNALYTVFIGGNDVIDATRTGSGTSAVRAGVEAELAAVQTLASAGARKLLVVNVADVGAIPAFALLNPALAPTATAYSQLYDSLLAAGLAGLTLSTGTTLTQFDLYAANQTILANPGAYGLSDVTNPCYTNAPLFATTTAACGANAQNIGDLAFWNDVHPTAKVHQLLGEQILAALGASPTSVPEPASLALLGAGLLGLVGARARRGR